MSFSAVSKKTGKTYYLHSKTVPFSGRLVTIYFFKLTESESAINLIPEGYEVFEVCRTGLPMLRKIK